MAGDAGGGGGSAPAPRERVRPPGAAAPMQRLQQRRTGWRNQKNAPTTRSAHLLRLHGVLALRWSGIWGLGLAGGARHCVWALVQAWRSASADRRRGRCHVLRRRVCAARYVWMRDGCAACLTPTSWRFVVVWRLIHSIRHMVPRRAALRGAGLEHYEISNYALPGHRRLITLASHGPHARAPNSPKQRLNNGGTVEQPVWR